MTISVPALPQGSQIVLTLASNALMLQPTFGGPTQRIARMGDKWQIKVSCRALIGAQAALIQSIVEQGLSDKLRLSVGPQDFDVSQVGNPAISGGTAGQSVTVSGLNAGCVLNAGQFFNIVTNGVYSLYKLSAAVTADSNGNATLTFYPMLKQAPNSGDHVEFVAPQIEGFLDGNQQSSSRGLTQAITMDISLTEAL